ncbi:MAG TPA: dienelactone hydrolase family protein, partial [Acidimicrobiales bacterium]|nr:dienelactone hydrolase family protein [Acidimicrobiales bacterium]
MHDLAATPTPRVGERASVPGVDGGLSALVVRPEPSAPAAPGILVLPDVQGYDASTEAAAVRLAAAGYLAVALDLFSPLGPPPPRSDRSDWDTWTRRLDDRRQLSDLSAAVAWLGHQRAVDPGRLGILGFSVGGRYAMLLATGNHELSAVVTFYSDPRTVRGHPGMGTGPADLVGSIGVPVCAVYAADDDTIAPESAARFAADLAANPGCEAHVVPGRHLFAKETRPTRY